MIRIKFLLCFTLLLYLGTHQALSAQTDRDVTQLFEAVGERAGSMLGYAVAGLGDQNGDGFDDILASAPGDRKAFVFFGGNTMDTIPDIVFHVENEEWFGGRLCNIGDINNDFYDDFAIVSNNMTRVYLGGIFLDTLADIILPAGRIRAAGDVNGDGYDDILQSEDSWHSSQGKVSIYLGGAEPDSMADWSVVGDSAGYWFGNRISGNGDINGDGYDDIAISGFRFIHSQAYSYIKIFYGGSEMDTVPALIMDSYEQDLNIWTPTVIVDMNGDNFSDLSVVAYPDTAALLFWGPIVPDILPDLILNGSSLSGDYWEIAEAGDVNNDSFPDMIVGNYNGWGGLGEVLIFLGGPMMDGDYDIGFTGYMHSYNGAGRSVGKAGDVNGDNTDDILFGAWMEYGSNREGRVMIFSGDSTLTLVSSNPSISNKPCYFSLLQNYPNPFNSSTEISYQILGTQPSEITMRIYNILGEEVMILVDTVQASGFYRVTWNGRNKMDLDVGSGIYFCQLQIASQRQMIKMLLIR